MKSDMWKHRPSWQQNTQSAPSAAYFDIRHSLFDIRYSDRAEDEPSRGHFGLGEPRCNFTSHGSADDYQLNRTPGCTNARKTRMLFARGYVPAPLRGCCQASRSVNLTDHERLVA